MQTHVSKTSGHYPHIRFRDGKKMLWNPVLKKVFVNRPEERIRLQFVEYLRNEAGFSMYRLSFESPVKPQSNFSSSRADIIAYDENLKPLLLVECKAEAISLDEKTAVQAARYHQSVQSPFILLTNGRHDFWFDMGAISESPSPSLKPMRQLPPQFQPKLEMHRDFTYWKERGFAGPGASPDLRKFLVESCNALFTDSPHMIKYLDFKNLSDKYEAAHYYRIFTPGDNLRLALSLAATPYGGSRLFAVLNRDKENRALLIAHLDLVTKKEALNAEIHSQKGIEYLDLLNNIPELLQKNAADFQEQFLELLHG